MLSRILTFLKGSLTIEAEGDFLERFLNVCMHRGIFLADIKRFDKQKLRAKMGITGFKKVRPIAKKTRTKIRIKRRSGMPFLIRRYQRRRFALLGVLAFFVVLWYLSSHIMGIDIIGNERLSVAELEAGLKGFGLYRGATVKDIDRRLVQNKMMTAFEELAWIGVNVKGSRAYIEVRERLDNERAVDRSIPCNIVATKDGQIDELRVLAGQTMVKLGDMVEKGDLLVSGAVDSSIVGIRYAHSEGEIYARTTYKKTREYPLKYIEKEYTGNVKVKCRYSVFGKEISIFKSEREPFEYSDKTETAEEYYFVSNKFLQFLVKKTEYREYIPKKKKRTPEETANLGKEELAREIENEVKDRAEVLKREFSYREIGNDKIEVVAEFLCREDIAGKVAIDKA